MSNIKKLQELAEQSLKELELVQAEKLPQNNIDIATRFLSLAEAEDKNGLLNFSNYDFLFMVICFFNNHEFAFDEIKRDVEKVRLIANSWQAGCRESLKTLNQLYSKTSTSESIIKINQELEKLGLHELADKYNLSMVFPFMFFFINFKYLAGKVNQDTQDIVSSKFKKNDYDFRPISSPEIKNKKMKELILKSGLIDVISFVRKYKNELISKHSDRKKISAESIKYTKELLDAIKAEEIEDIGLIHTEWIKYLNPKVLQVLFEIVLNNLSTLFEKKKEENKSLQDTINKNQVTSFLYSHQINPKSLSEPSLNYLETLENENFGIIETLNFLYSLKINLVDFLNNYYQHISKLNHEKISILSFLLNYKYLTSETLKANINLIENGFIQLIANYEILKSVLDVSNAHYNDSILLKPTIELKRILEIIAEYDLTRNNYIFLLCNFKYLPIYDLLLENDIPVYLFISICQTENPLLTIKRILIYKSIGENYKTNTMLLKKDVRDETKFICKDEALDTYLLGVLRITKDYFSGASLREVKKTDIVRNFDKKFTNTENKNVYNFNGILISRPKFLRQLSSYQELNLKSVINAIIGNSILSDEECDIIMSLCKEQSKKLF